MPPEIADSDAESELNSPKGRDMRTGKKTPSQHPEYLTEQDPVYDFSFEQFLSPTQRINSSERQDSGAPRGTGSTDRFLAEISQPQDGVFHSTMSGFDGSADASMGTLARVKPKRSFSDIEEGAVRNFLDDEANRKSVKRAKTYGASRSQRSDTSSALFPDIMDHESGDTSKTTDDTVSEQEQNLYLGLTIDPRHVDQTSALHESANPYTRQSYSIQQPMSMSHSGLQTTRSSLGGYEVINMDFRGTGMGLDTSANPFGSLSQVSLEGDNKSAEAERLKSFFRNDNSIAHNEHYTHGEINSIGEDATREDINDTTTPGESRRSGDAPKAGQNKTDVSRKTSTKKVDVENMDDERTIPMAPPYRADSELRDPAEAQTNKSAKRKRGRPSKAQRPLSRSSLVESDEVQDEFWAEVREAENHHATRSRAGTIDSLPSQTHTDMQDVSNQKRKQKKSVQPQAETSSQVKHAKSELHLDDETVIGLPRENYKPRPSRSRSKKEEDEKVSTREQQEESRDPPDVVQEDPSPEKQSAPAKKKESKKSKVKRAKTSAAALLRKTEEMLDEDDKDIIFMDSKPAKVKMDVPPAVSPVKTEEQSSKADPMDTDSEADDEEITRGKSRRPKKITIDIPMPNIGNLDGTSNQVPPEPKKRGRKPKKKPDTPVTIHPSEDDLEENNHEQPSQPTVLSERDPNVNTPISGSATATSKLKPNSKVTSSANSREDTGPTPSPISPSPPPPASLSKSNSTDKPVHSPLKPRSPAAQLNATTTTTTISSTTTTNDTTTTTTSTSTSSTPLSNLFTTKPRIGLSRRMRIPSLLRKLDRTKDPPKVVERKEKLTKRQQAEEDKRKLEMEDGGDIDDGGGRYSERGKDGMLIEWDF